MSNLIPGQHLSNQDRDFNNFRESPEHGKNNPARAVIIENDLSDPIPVQVVDGEPGTPIHFNSGELSTTGLLQTLISETVPASTEYDLYNSIVVSRSHGKFTIMIDGDLIGSGRTGPSIGSMSRFSWGPRYIATSGQLIEVRFQSSSSAPINEVEAYLQVASRSV